jgi:hypothetical protein
VSTLKDYFNQEIAPIRFTQAWQARAVLSNAYRPFGAKVLTAKIAGLHGPETGFVIRKPDGSKGYFICGRGRILNLTEGTTQISDIEVPSSILPSSTADLL